MDEKEYVDFQQEQKDFEDENRQRANRVLDEVTGSLSLARPQGVKLVEELAKSDDLTVAESARDLLGDL